MYTLFALYIANFTNLSAAYIFLPVLLIGPRWIYSGSTRQLKKYQNNAKLLKAESNESIATSKAFEF